VDEPTARLLAVIKPGETLKAAELMQRLGLRHRASFREHYLLPALGAGHLEMTDPASPRSPAQKYRREQRAR
jgi:hypothetical protein